jgi:hypothetical protein
MKKALASLIALATVCSMATIALADTDSGVDIVADNALATYLEYDSTTGNITANQGDLVLVAADKRLVLPDAELKPGTEYKFDIYYALDQVTGYNNSTDIDTTKFAKLTGAEMDGAKIKLRVRTTKTSSSVASIKINTRGSGNNTTYQVVIATREEYGVKQNEVSYNIVFSGGTPTFVTTLPPPELPEGETYAEESANLTAGSASFLVGWKAISQDLIDNYGEEDILTIDSERPVIKKDQFTTLAQNANYRPVILEGQSGEWAYEGRVSGMSAANFYTTHEAVPAVVNAMADNQDFKFFTFSAGVTFPTNGELRLDVSDISDDFDTIYTYLYRDGILTPIATSYDSSMDQIYFRTNYLGAFLMTDREITNEDLLGNTDNGTDIAEPEPEPENHNTQNPGTGAADGTLALLGLASVAGAFVSRKKK